MLVYRDACGIVAPLMHKQLHSESYAAFTALLRETRERKQISQTTLADRLQAHQSFVSKVENGQRRLDAVELLEWLGALRAHPEVFIRTLSERLGTTRRTFELVGGGDPPKETRR